MVYVVALLVHEESAPTRYFSLFSSLTWKLLITNVYTRLVIQVMEYVMSLTAPVGQSAPEPGSMRVAMAYPADAAR